MDVEYSYQGSRHSLNDYPVRNPITGLLIAKDDEILFEHYRYGNDVQPSASCWLQVSEACGSPYRRWEDDGFSTCAGRRGFGGK